MSAPRWRVGSKGPRNVYRDERMVLVAVGEDEEAARLAARVVEEMNRAEQE